MRLFICSEIRHAIKLTLNGPKSCCTPFLQEKKPSVLQFNWTSFQGALTELNFPFFQVGWNKKPTIDDACNATRRYQGD